MQNNKKIDELNQKNEAENQESLDGDALKNEEEHTTYSASNAVDSDLRVWE